MIIAIKEKDRIVVAYADSHTGRTEMDYLDEDNIPMKFSEDGNLFGFAKIDRRSEMFLYDDKFMSMEISPKNMVREMLHYMKRKLEQYNCHIDEEEFWGNALVVCDESHLYDVDTEFNFQEVQDYVCHGYSIEIAKSVLDLTVGWQAEKRIVEVVRQYEKIYNDVMFPIVLADTRTKEFRIIHEGEEADEYCDRI